MGTLLSHKANSSENTLTISWIFKNNKFLFVLQIFLSKNSKFQNFSIGCNLFKNNEVLVFRNTTFTTGGNIYSKTRSTLYLETPLSLQGAIYIQKQEVHHFHYRGQYLFKNKKYLLYLETSLSLQGAISIQKQEVLVVFRNTTFTTGGNIYSKTRSTCCI